MKSKHKKYHAKIWKMEPKNSKFMKKRVLKKFVNGIWITIYGLK